MSNPYPDFNDETLFRKFASGYSVQGIANAFGCGYMEIEMRLRALMVGMQIANANRETDDD